ncbi:amino acid ABC transporter [Rheinheimera sp.]|uniref:amino acid ABC transporter n=1 Tax=Rheinheimera sp. TaxID=1869214 RepID=UPI003D2DF945
MLRIPTLLTLLLTTLAAGNLQAAQPTTTAKSAVALRFCYEDKPLEPYYRGHGAQVPKDYPGATIEHLYQLTAAIPGVSLTLERLPWKRCLSKLQAGETDALVASYRPEREDIGNYPMLDGKPDPSRAFSEHHTCLVKKADSQWTWDGERVQGIDSLVVARPLGYAPLIVPGPQQVSMHYTLSGTMDLDLLQAGRIHAVTTLCKIAGQAVVSSVISDLGLQVLQPPLHSNTGYLVFSKQFSERHPQLSAALWRELQLNKAIPIYRNYLKLHFLQPSAENNTQ